MTDHTQLRKLAEAVKPGWFTCHTGKCVGQCVRGRIGELVTREGEDEHPDFAFIAAANPQAIIELLDRVALLEKAVEEYNQPVPLTEWQKLLDENARLKKDAEPFNASMRRDQQPAQTDE